jgi:predicted nucleotidyltransferase
MELTAQKKGKKINGDDQSLFVIQKVKEIVCRYDKGAELILFGSRARGDWHEESDWDFLVLTDRKDTEWLSDAVRKNIFNSIELVSFDTVFILVKNRKEWEEEYEVTTLYQSINEEGLSV